MEASTDTTDIKSEAGPPSYQSTTPSAATPQQSKAFTLELIHCAPKGLSASGAVLTGPVLQSLNDVISISPQTTYQQLSDLVYARGATRSQIRDVFPPAEVDGGEHMVIRLELGKKSLLVDPTSWEDCRSLLLGNGEGFKEAGFKAYYAKTPKGWARTAKKFGRPGGKKGKKCVVQ